MDKKALVPAIEVEGLRKVYRHIVAVDDVSFVMYHGEAFGFLKAARIVDYYFVAIHVG